MIHNKTILVTGAAGFIGANLVRKLLLPENKINIFVKKTTNLWRLKDILSYIKLYNVSLIDQKQTSKVVKKIKPEIIYHLAAHGSYSHQTDPIKIIKTNIIGTTNLIWALNSINYKCFINTGSSSEYGFKKKPMRESDILEPESFYAATKAASTYLCQVFAKSLNKPIVTLRPFSVYGPYEEPTRLIPTVINNILKNKPVKLTTQDIRRDFIYIDDLVDCYLKIPSVINKKLYGEIFNVGTSKQYSNYEVVKTIIKIIKTRVIIQKGAYQERSWDTDFWVADISKAKKYLKWQPKISLSKGLKKTINWQIKFLKKNEQKQSSQTNP